MATTSGKSGYVRILKNACRTRDGYTNIRRNVEDTANTPQSAMIGFMRGAVPDSFAWTPQAATHGELPSVSIFDTRSANIHVEKTNAVAYIPAPMQVMEALAAACDAVKLRIDAQVNKLQAQTPHVIRSPALSADTAAGAFLHRLSAKSNLTQLGLLSTVSAEEAKHLTELEADLAQDPKKVVARLTAQRTKPQNIRAQLAKLSAVATDDAFKKRSALQADLTQKSEAAKLASNKLFEASPLPDVGKEVWRSLWEAARRYSDQAAYPAQRFPAATAEKDLCVLCQQPLSKEAVTRRQTFESFVQGTTRADELAAEKAVSTFMESLEKLRIRPSAYREGVTYVATELGDEALADAIRRVTTIAAWRLRAVLKGKKRPCAAAAFPDAACKAAHPDKRFIVGIAMDARGVKGSSEDFLSWDTAEWTAEEIQEAQVMRDELAWFKGGNAVLPPIFEDEYPGSRRAADVPKLAEKLSSLTVAESLEVAAMLKAKWGTIGS